VRADSVSSLIVAAGERLGLLGGGFRKPDAFLGHEMRGPAGTWLCLDGWRAGRPKRKEGKWVEGPYLAITTILV